MMMAMKLAENLAAIVLLMLEAKIRTVVLNLSASEIEGKNAYVTGPKLVLNTGCPT
jgi:hypothetical protein